MPENLKQKAAETKQKAAQKAKQHAAETKRLADELPRIVGLADALMAGHVLDRENRRLSAEFLSDDDGEDWIPKEREARIAMAILLRSGLPLEQDFRDRLAALFDPDDGTHPAIDRKLIFKPRKRQKGGARDHVRDTAIAQYVYDLICQGMRMEAAQKKAEKHFNLSFHTVRDICGHSKTRKGLLESIKQIGLPFEQIDLTPPVVK